MRWRLRARRTRRRWQRRRARRSRRARGCWLRQSQSRWLRGPGRQRRGHWRRRARQRRGRQSRRRQAGSLLALRTLRAAGACDWSSQRAGPGSAAAGTLRAPTRAGPLIIAPGAEPKEKADDPAPKPPAGAPNIVLADRSAVQSGGRRKGPRRGPLPLRCASFAFVLAAQSASRDRCTERLLGARRSPRSPRPPPRPPKAAASSKSELQCACGACAVAVEQSNASRSWRAPNRFGWPRKALQSQQGSKSSSCRPPHDASGIDERIGAGASAGAEPVSRVVCVARGASARGLCCGEQRASARGS